MKYLFLLIALLFLPTNASAAIAANDAFTTVASGASKTVTAATDVVLVCFVYNNGASPAVTAVSYGGHSLTQIGTTQVGGVGNAYAAGAWILANPPTGSNTLTVTGTSVLTSYCGTRKGVNQTSPVDNNGLSFKGDNTGALSLQVTGIAASGDWMDAGVHITDGIASIGGVFTQQVGSGAAEIFELSSNGTIGTGSQTGSWTRTIGTGRAAIAIVLQPSSAAPPLWWNWDY